MCTPSADRQSLAGLMPGWQYFSPTVDSGAAETVVPHALVQDHAMHETGASRSGLNYASGTGDPVPNLGEQKLPLLAQQGSLRAMTFQAATVDRAPPECPPGCTPRTWNARPASGEEVEMERARKA